MERKIKQSVKDKAKKITMSFEGGGYSNISGNFDKMGLSLGFLQWNLGQGTLQPLLRDFLKNNSLLAKSIMKDDADNLLAALNSGSALEFARSKMNGPNDRIIEPWLSYFKYICATKEFQEIQNTYAVPYFNRAVSLCNLFNIYTERAFCLFYDIVVQNGGIRKFPDTSTLTGIEKLKRITETVVASSNPRWQNDVRARKECIINGNGIVHGTRMILDVSDREAFEIDISEFLRILRSANIIGSPDYWMENSISSKTVKGEFIEQVIKNFLKKYADYDEKSTDKNPISYLKELGLISSVDYWSRNAVEGGSVNGEYAAILIKNMACKLI